MKFFLEIIPYLSTWRNIVLGNSVPEDSTLLLSRRNTPCGAGAHGTGVVSGVMKDLA